MWAVAVIAGNIRRVCWYRSAAIIMTTHEMDDLNRCLSRETLSDTEPAE
jgi:ABC-type uncharacterized transport system ATPase subunit